MDLDSKSNILVSGYFDDSVDADPGLSVEWLVSKGAKDMYLVKLDSSGNRLRSKSFGNKRDDNGSALIVDEYDNILMTGYFTDTLTISTDTGIVTVASTFTDAAIILKFDSSGKFKWSKKFDDFASRCMPADIKQDKNKNIYLLGNFYGNIDFDPGPDSFYVLTYDAPLFLARLDSAGNFNDVKVFKGHFSSGFKPNLSVDTHSNIIINGTFSELMDADPGIDSFILSSIDADHFETFTLKFTSCIPAYRSDTIRSCGSFSLFDETYTKNRVYKKCSSIVPAATAYSPFT